MAKKIHEIHNSDIWDYYKDVDQMRKEFWENENYTEDKMKNMPDEDVIDLMHEHYSDYWDEVITEIKVHEKNHGQKRYLIIASLGLWNGVHNSYGVTGGLTNAISRCFGRDTNSFNFYQEGKNLILECSHHDGVNTFTIKELTKRGEEIYENNIYMYEPSLGEKLDKKGYIRNVTMFNEIYGW